MLLRISTFILCVETLKKKKFQKFLRVVTCNYVYFLLFFKIIIFMIINNKFNYRIN